MKQFKFIKNKIRSFKEMKSFNKKLHSNVYADPLGVISKKEYIIEQQKYLNKLY